MKSAGGFRDHGNVLFCWKSGSRLGLASSYTSLTGVKLAWVVPEKVAVIDSVAGIPAAKHNNRVRFRVMFQIGFRSRSYIECLALRGKNDTLQDTLPPFQFFPSFFSSSLTQPDFIRVSTTTISPSLSLIFSQQASLSCSRVPFLCIPQLSSSTSSSSCRGRPFCAFLIYPSSSSLRGYPFCVFLIYCQHLLFEGVLFWRSSLNTTHTSTNPSRASFFGVPRSTLLTTLEGIFVHTFLHTALLTHRPPFEGVSFFDIHPSQHSSRISNFQRQLSQTFIHSALLTPQPLFVDVYFLRRFSHSAHTTDQHLSKGFFQSIISPSAPHTLNIFSQCPLTYTPPTSVVLRMTTTRNPKQSACTKCLTPICPQPGRSKPAKIYKLYITSPKTASSTCNESFSTTNQPILTRFT